MCDTFVTLTDDGSLFAKNSDRDVNEAQYLDWVPALDHPVGSTLRCTWIDVAQVPHTRAVMLSRPWWIWGAEMGANDAGVVAGNEAVFTSSSVGRRPRDEPALLGMDLLRLGLERGGTAHEAVSVMIDLLERHGQGGPHSHDHPNFTYDNSFMVADASEAIVLETAGREWVTEQVRPGTTRSISNVLTIEPFATHHMNRLRTRIGNGRTRCATTSRVAGGATGPADMARALRSHDGTAALACSPISGSMTSPCMHIGGLVTSSQTVSSWISDLRSGARHWATATAAPCLSIFKPISVDEPLDLGPVPDRTFDPRTSWWRHELLHRFAARDIMTASQHLDGLRRAVEEEWFESPPGSAAAFARAEALEDELLESLRGIDLQDVRPWWVRRLWAAADRAAGFSDPGDGPVDGHRGRRAVGPVAR